MEIGWRIPSYARPKTVASQSRALVPYCVSVEEQGFDAIWVIDHMLIAPDVYSVAWLDPLITLAAIAGATEKIKLGTAILCAPMRHPVSTAKMVASIDHLAGGGRFILGVGTGHDLQEFNALGISRRERGKTTDEMLDIVRRLLSEDNVHYDGKYFSFEDISIYPRPDKPVPIWIGGGSQVHMAENPDQPVMVPSVLERIVKHDGWICRSSGTDEDIIRRDLDIVKTRLAEDKKSDDFTLSCTQWIHIVPSTDRSKVIEEQLQAYRSVMDDQRTDRDLQLAYLFGTVDELIERIRSLKSSGIQHLILNPLSEDRAQVELFGKEILPNI